MSTKIRVVQINLNTARAATSLLDHTIQERDIDIALIQEPNKKIASGKKYVCDKSSRAAILLPQESKLKGNNWGVGDGMVWVDTGSVTYLSCYISPNSGMQEYERVLDDLRTVVRNVKNEIIIGGDFNAKSFLWEAAGNDRRGEILGDLIGELDLVVLNQGTTPTLRRRNCCSIIDVTLASRRIAAKVKNWNVDDITENLSDHNYIFLEITDNNLTRHEQTTGRWRITEAGLKMIGELTREWKDTDAEINIQEDRITDMIREMCEKALPKKKKGRGKQPVHWWCPEVAEARRASIAARRQFQRANRRQLATAEDKAIAEREYKAMRKQLKYAITKAKQKAWNCLISEIDQDVWGLGYRIATGKLRQNPPHLTIGALNEQIEALFPDRPPISWDKLPRDSTANNEIDSDFTDEEVQLVIKKAKRKKAPGPDGIPAEVLKTVAEANVTILTSAYNNVWRVGAFPTPWKACRLILVEKPDSVAENRKYRPICLLNTIGKMYESLIKLRLEKALATTEELYEHQYGFRTGRSTVNAVEQVLSIVDNINKVSYVCRRFCIMITLDIKNAFNSLRWETIIEELKRRKLPNSLILPIQNYLSNRKIITGKNTIHSVTCGVPQGSVLGPTLWNIAYDTVLKSEMPPETKLIAFADDLAVVISARDTNTLQDRATEAIQKITNKLQIMGLQLAHQKTEMVILAGRMKLQELTIHVGNHDITAKKHIKYLGVTLDKDAKMIHHVNETVRKAEKQVAALSRLMPNLRGPKQATRRLYASVITSTILYAAPTWSRVWKIKKYAAMLERVNRSVALRNIMAYRSVSLEASLVLAGMPPIELLARERCQIHKRDDRTTARKQLLLDWQTRWSASKESWTKRLIPQVDAWVNRSTQNQDLNFHTTQILTGHGVFKKYLHRIGKSGSPNCWYCEEVDDAEHTLFICPRWNNERRKLTISLGVDVTVANFTETMTTNQSNWKEITDLTEIKIMSAKESKEREIERGIDD